jgi:ABC-type glycerol-3-phosphate transport system permease component
MVKHKTRGQSAVMYAILILWLVVCLFPLYNMISTTFSSDSSNLTSTFLPNDFSNGWDKIMRAFTEANILDASIDTLSYTIITIIGMILVCSLVAYEFTFYQFPLKKPLYALILMSMMFPMVLYVIPLYRFVVKLGLADTIAGISAPLIVSPLSVFILMQFLEDMPMSFVESARIDGAGHFRIFWHIVFPLMHNGVITATVLMFLNVWGAYLWPSLASGANLRPMSVTIANLLSPQFYIDPRVKIAAMLLSAVPPLLIYLFFQRYVISGITMSGVKG